MRLFMIPCANDQSRDTQRRARPAPASADRDHAQVPAPGPPAHAPRLAARTPAPRPPPPRWHVDALARCGIPRATVVTGFASEHVEALLAQRTTEPDTRFLYNPFFRVSDNLGSCWIAGG